MCIIDVNNVSKSYKVYQQQTGLKNTIKNFIRPQVKIVEAVKNLSFQINEGEAIGFIGENGAGKSTTIKMMAGILYPTNGSVIIKGIKPYEKRRENAKNIGVVFGQRSRLMWDLPMRDSFEVYKEIYHIDQQVYKNNVDMFVELLSMKDFLQTPIRQLSLGQRMKVEISLSLLHNPDILFLDEPTIGLDVIAKQQIRNFLNERNKVSGVTTILTSHDMKDLDMVCSRIIMIQKGELFYDGSIQEFKEKFSKESMIEFGIEKMTNTEDLENSIPYHIVKTNNNSITIGYNKNVDQIQEIIYYVCNRYNVKNISFIDSDIEDIVRSIYENSQFEVDGNE